MWIWEGYFNPNNRDKWLAAAEKLRRINPHVIQDMEDFILLDTYKNKKIRDVKGVIEGDLHSKRLQKRNRDKEEEEKEKL